MGALLGAWKILFLHLRAGYVHAFSLWNPMCCTLVSCVLFCTQYTEVAQLCPTLCDPMDCSPPGSSVHGIFQAWILEWVAVSFFCMQYLNKNFKKFVKPLLNSLQYCFFFFFFLSVLVFFFFWPRVVWDLSFPTRDQTHTSCTGRSLNHWATREVPTFFLKKAKKEAFSCRQRI